MPVCQSHRALRRSVRWLRVRSSEAPHDERKRNDDRRRSRIQHDLDDRLLDGTPTGVSRRQGDGRVARCPERGQDVGEENQLATAEVAFMLHSLCAGLASNELARQAPPAGVGFWSHVPQLDAEKLWHDALRAVISGLSDRDGPPRSVRVS